MLKRFYPSERNDSAYLIDYDAFFQKGMRGIIFDIDNTLVPHGFPADDKAKELFDRLNRLGYKTLLLSNNKRERVESFARSLPGDVYFIYKGDKPLKRGYIRAMEIMGTDEQTTLFVGDQLFTDVFGANRLNIHTVLTRPIDPREEIQIILKRYLEKIVLYFYERSRKNDN